MNENNLNISTLNINNNNINNNNLVNSTINIRKNSKKNTEVIQNNNSIKNEKSEVVDLDLNKSSNSNSIPENNIDPNISDIDVSENLQNSDIFIRQRFNIFPGNNTENLLGYRSPNYQNSNNTIIYNNIINYNSDFSRYHEFITNIISNLPLILTGGSVIFFISYFLYKRYFVKNTELPPHIYQSVPEYIKYSVWKWFGLNANHYKNN